MIGAVVRGIDRTCGRGDGIVTRPGKPAQLRHKALEEERAWSCCRQSEQRPRGRKV